MSKKQKQWKNFINAQSFRSRFLNRDGFKIIPRNPYSYFLDKYQYLDIFHLHDDPEEQVDAPRTFDKSIPDIQLILDSVEINNFKSIINSKFEIGNTSFIGGFNSSGKSTHTQLILLLIQWLSGESLAKQTSIPLNGPFISLGDNAEDLINRALRDTPHGRQIKKLTNIDIKFNFSTKNDPLGSNVRSIRFRLILHKKSKSSFDIEEISIIDKILSSDRIQELGKDSLFNQAKSVSYIRKYSKTNIEKELHKNHLDNIETSLALGGTFNSPSSFSYTDGEIDFLSYFTEEVLVDDNIYSLNVLHPYNISISPKHSYVDRSYQPHFFVKTEDLIKVNLFENYIAISSQQEFPLNYITMTKSLSNKETKSVLEDQEYFQKVVLSEIESFPEYLDATKKEIKPVLKALKGYFENAKKDFTEGVETYPDNKGLNFLLFIHTFLTVNKLDSLNFSNHSKEDFRIGNPLGDFKLIKKCLENPNYLNTGQKGSSNQKNLEELMFRNAIHSFCIFVYHLLKDTDLPDTSIDRLSDMLERQLNMDFRGGSDNEEEYYSTIQELFKLISSESSTILPNVNDSLKKTELQNDVNNLISESRDKIFEEIKNNFYLRFLTFGFDRLNFTNNLLTEAAIIKNQEFNPTDLIDLNEPVSLVSSYLINQSIQPYVLIDNKSPLNNFTFLNSSRGYTYESEFYGGSESAPIGINGEYTAAYLFLYGNDVISGPEINDNALGNIIQTLLKGDKVDSVEDLGLKTVNLTLLEHLNQWLSYIFDLEEKMEVRESSYGKYNIYLGNDLISNVGSGISQALPIILNILISSKGRIVFLEEVEQNLHASAQAKIADMIIFYSLFNRKFVVETHSEHILNRVRLRKIQFEKRFDTENLFNIYFVSNDEEKGSYAEKISLNKKGQFESDKVRKGFFDQSQLDTLEIIKEIKEL